MMEEGHRDSKVNAAKAAKALFEKLLTTRNKSILYSKNNNNDENNFCNLQFAVKNTLRFYRKTKNGVWIKPTEISSFMIYYEDTLKSLYLGYLNKLYDSFHSDYSVLQFRKTYLILLLQLMNCNEITESK